MHPSTLAKRGTILVFFVFTAFYFYGLGHLPFIGPDEPRYAEVAHEMLLRRDWITPTLAGHLWFEKPALLYWLIIAAFRIGGVSEASARLGAALCGILTIAGVIWIAKRVERDSFGDTASVAFFSALVAGASGGLIAFSRAASFDIVITATVTWSLAFFFAFELANATAQRRRLLVGFYFAIGVSLLAKGLVGFVIPFGVIGAYYTLRGKAPRRELLTSVLWGVPLSLLISASWYGPMIWKHGAPFLVEFIIKHHFQRYATNVYHHPGPIYYYLEILPALTLPWTAYFFAAMWRARNSIWRGASDAQSKLQTFAVAWLILPLIFFSVSSSKLPGYILPALPAAALLTGLYLAKTRGGSATWPTRVTGVLSLLSAIALLVFARQSGKISIVIAATVAAICALVAIATLFLRKQSLAPAVTIAAATVAIVIIASIKIAPPLVEQETSKTLIQIANESGYRDLPIFGLQRDDRTPEFYGAGRVVYGEDHEPVMYDGIGQVVYESHARGTMLFLVPLADVDLLLQDESVRAQRLADNGRIAIVVVTPL
ncbi:MAG TPA: glycosyltransferase family 39 protein [Pyrinomonadaceae bacterium]|nr:glycosyltransferase family 39 protein [Pyrinomonadaceae bacterium]